MPGEPDWNAIAEYVKLVAWKACRRGYLEAPGHEEDGEGAQRAADFYTASGFDADTVRRYFPGSRRKETPHA